MKYALSFWQSKKNTLALFKRGVGKYALPSSGRVVLKYAMSFFKKGDGEICSPPSGSVVIKYALSFRWIGSEICSALLYVGW